MQLRAMMHVSNRRYLLRIAEQLDLERANGRLRGPLHGIPIVVKDMWQLNPASGVPCTAGMIALQKAKHKESSELVKKVHFLPRMKCHEDGLCSSSP